VLNSSPTHHGLIAKKDEQNTTGFPLISLRFKNTITYFAKQGTASFFTLSSPDGCPGCGVHAQGAAAVYYGKSIIKRSAKHF